MRPFIPFRSFAPAFAGGATAWSPLALFAAGEKGAWYDPSDLSTMFQDSAGTTPVTAVEQPVGLVLDKSGNDNHLAQATTAARPVLRESGGSWYLDFDGVDDHFVFGVSGSNSMVLVGGVSSSDQLGALVGAASSGALFISQDGSTSSISSGCGTPSHFVDESPVADRNGLYDALATGGSHVIEATSLDLSNAQWASGGVFARNAPLGSTYFAVKVYGLIIAETPTSMVEVREWMAGKSGVTLP